MFPPAYSQAASIRACSIEAWGRPFSLGHRIPDRSCAVFALEKSVLCRFRMYLTANDTRALPVARILRWSIEGSGSFEEPIWAEHLGGRLNRPQWKDLHGWRRCYSIGLDARLWRNANGRHRFESGAPLRSISPPGGAKIAARSYCDRSPPLEFLILLTPILNWDVWRNCSVTSSRCFLSKMPKIIAFIY